MGRMKRRCAEGCRCGSGSDVCRCLRRLCSSFRAVVSVAVVVVVASSVALALALDGVNARSTLQMATEAWLGAVHDIDHGGGLRSRCLNGRDRAVRWS